MQKINLRYYISSWITLAIYRWQIYDADRWISMPEQLKTKFSNWDFFPKGNIIASVERSPNADLSQVSLDSSPWKDLVTSIWPPRSRGKLNEIMAKPCAVHFMSICYVIQSCSLWRLLSLFSMYGVFFELFFFQSDCIVQKRQCSLKADLSGIFFLARQKQMTSSQSTCMHGLSEKSSSCKFSSCRTVATVFYPETHEVDLWQV